jgi:hypothetical protein
MKERALLLFVLRPLVLWDGSLDVQPLAGLHVVHVARHGALLVLLDDEVDGTLLVDVASGRVRSNDGLLHVGALVLGDDSGYKLVSEALE